MKNTLPDKLDPRDLREVCDVGDISGVGKVTELPAWRDMRRREGDCGAPAVVPLVMLALSVALATTALAPRAAAAGIPGAAALLFASMTALFGALLAVVSVSVVTTIAAMLLPRARRGTRPVVRVRPSLAPVPWDRLHAVRSRILSVCRWRQPYGPAGP